MDFVAKIRIKCELNINNPESWQTFGVHITTS